MPSSPRIRFIALFGLALLSGAGNGLAQKINWGNAAGSINMDSHGNPLNGAFTFQLGTFVDNAGGNPLLQYTPSVSETSIWGTNWVPLDTAVYNQSPPPNESQGFFSDSWIPSNNDYQGFQAYIWVYNNQTGDETSEWVLISDGAGIDAWYIPPSTGSQQNFPYQWRVSTATDLIFGGMKNVDGPGVTDAGTPPTFSLQTNTFPNSPVPEPSVILLLGISFGRCFLRRRSVAC